MSSIKELRDVIDRAKIHCKYCGTLLKGKNLKWYKHDGGRLVKDFPYRVWLYVVCEKCKYQWALWKLEEQVAERDASVS